MRAKVIIIALLLALAISSALFSGMNVGFVIPAPELNYSVFDTIYEKYVIYNNGTRQRPYRRQVYLLIPQKKYL